ncbi:MAG: TraR/DksA family transcriptional regulator [Saprospirales bacterium]|nr:MAG: TraR/DksA family transcriptional regulator [Saprospirales bacterium]
MKLSDQERKSIANKIRKVTLELEQQIAQLKENTQPISPENSIGRVSRMDAINNKGVAEAALRSRMAKLVKLKTALGKLNEESFGICDRCKNPIALPRLMYMPESDYCIHCAK